MGTALSLKILIFLVLLLCSAVFSASETAFTALGKIKLRHLLEQKVKGAKRLESILVNPKRFITGILIGNNIINVGASALATAIMLDFLHNLGIKNLAADMAIITLVMALILLIFCEITPKIFAIVFTQNFALFLALPIKIFLYFINPIIILFEKFSLGLFKIFGLSAREAEQKLLTVKELRTMVDIGEEEGVLERKETQMIHGIFELSEKIVREVMTPRTDAVLLNIKSTTTDAIRLFIEQGFSRIPVYSEKIDNIMGILYAKDLLNIEENLRQVSIKKFMREATFIPESQSIGKVLQQMKKSKIHFAVVIDEYGGVSGIITLEDILEEIIGEIHDEYDVNEQPYFNELAPNQYFVDARMNIDNLSDKLDIKFPLEEDYDTIGGFIIHELGRFPQKGERIIYKNLQIIVKEVKKSRILKVEIVKKHKVGSV